MLGQKKVQQLNPSGIHYFDYFDYFDYFFYFDYFNSLYFSFRWLLYYVFDKALGPYLDQIFWGKLLMDRAQPPF